MSNEPSPSTIDIDVLVGYMPPSQLSSPSLLPTISEEDELESEKIYEKDTTERQIEGQVEEIEDSTKATDTNFVYSQDIQFVLDTMTKQAPFDKAQIKQIFYGICSSQTSTKIHHNINSKKSGEGKSYLLKLVADPFPESFISIFNNMSDKALYHLNGFEAVKDEETGKYEDLKPIIKQLELEIEEIEEKIEETNDNQFKKSLKSEIKEIEARIQELKSKAVKIIDLDDKAFIFLDTPNEGLFNNLMSLLSQDSRDQLYTFTDKDSSGKHLQSRTVLLRGAPLIMTTQVVDDTRNYRFAEKNRRFIHVNPNATDDKIEEAMKQMAIKLGGPSDDFECIVSSKDIKKSKEIVANLCKKLKDHNQKFIDNDIKDNGTKIPYASILYSSLPTSDSWSMTILSRLLNYITIITKVNMDSRPKLVDIQTGVFYPISIYDDLKEALEIMKTASLSIRPYQQQWYNTVFLPAFEELGPEPNIKTNEHGTILAKESVVGLTTKDLADKMSKQGKTTSTTLIYENYLRPLTKQGVINSTRSIINGKENLYYPVNQENEDNNLSILPLTEDCRLIINKPLDEMIVLEESFRTLLGRRSNGGGVNKYKIIDIDDSEISLTDLLDRYFFSENHHTSCSVIESKYYNNVIEESSIVGEQSEVTEEDINTKLPSSESANSSGDNPKYTISSNSCLSYEYTIEDIEKFFASDFEYHKEHSLEESICKPLIGRQDHEPFFYYCKDEPDVVNIYLESIEHHIRYKDPERHKAKLLEMIREEQIDKDENKTGQKVTIRT